ncbi:MAG: lipoyl synthase, partial [bacterium]
NYEQSLYVLSEAKNICEGVKTKSGLMVGLGETRGEIEDVLRDLRRAEVDFLTIGQYLAPTPKHHPVREFVDPDVFREFEEFAYGLGFEYVASGPFVRSSYMAEAALERAKKVPT